MEHDVHLDVALVAPMITDDQTEQVGRGLLELVGQAQAAGIDADQALRDAVRDLEERVRAAEAVHGYAHLIPPNVD